MQVQITVDDIDSDDCSVQPWTATLAVTTDDGRVVECESAGIGPTIPDAVEDLFNNPDASNHDVLAVVTRQWHSLHPAKDCVIVEGGLVQNEPGIPVFDMDVIDSDVCGEAEVNEAINLRERMIDHDPDRLAYRIQQTEEFIRNHGTPDQIQTIEEKK